MACTVSCHMTSEGRVVFQLLMSQHHQRYAICLVLCSLRLTTDAQWRVCDHHDIRWSEDGGGGGGGGVKHNNNASLHIAS